MIEFRTQLQKKISELIQGWTGAASGLARPVKTFSDHIDDVPYDQFPYVVVNVRSFDTEDGEIGTTHALKTWEVHIYYMDVTQDYVQGDETRNSIMGLISKNIEDNPRLGNLVVTDTNGGQEYIYDSKITSGLFDSSGQEEDYSFVTELYINIFTASR